MASLASLPTELLHQICTELPVPSLISFGTTNRLHHALSLTALRSLSFGVFPSKIQGIASVLSAPTLVPVSEPAPTNIILPKSQSRSKDCVIRNQNQLATRVLSRHGRALRELELSIWTLNQSTAEQIAKLARLQHLSIKLDHPHTRHRDLRPGFWRDAERGTVWNSFFADTKEPATSLSPAEPGAGSNSEPVHQPRPTDANSNAGSAAKPVFGELRIITLERAGITDWQLSRLLAENPRVQELYLRKCTQVTDEFFAWLSRSKLASSLRVLHFEQSEGEGINEGILEHLECIKGLEDLSLSGCPNIPNDDLKTLARDTWPNLKHLALPQAISAGGSESIEVDPAYK